MRNWTTGSYIRIAQFMTEQGLGTEEPGEFDDFDTSQALRDATLPELEAIIRQMNKAEATLDFASLGEEYVYLFQNALESIKEMYENLYYSQDTENRLPQEEQLDQAV